MKKYDANQEGVVRVPLIHSGIHVPETIKGMVRPFLIIMPKRAITYAFSVNICFLLILKS